MDKYKNIKILLPQKTLIFPELLYAISSIHWSNFVGEGGLTKEPNVDLLAGVLQLHGLGCVKNNRVPWSAVGGGGVNSPHMSISQDEASELLASWRSQTTVDSSGASEADKTCQCYFWKNLTTVNQTTNHKHQHKSTEVTYMFHFDTDIFLRCLDSLVKEHVITSQLCVGAIPYLKRSGLWWPSLSKSLHWLVSFYRDVD